MGTDLSLKLAPHRIGAVKLWLENLRRLDVQIETMMLSETARRDRPGDKALISELRKVRKDLARVRERIEPLTR